MTVMEEFSLGLKQRDNCKYIISRLSLIVWVNVVLNTRLLLTVTDVSTTCAVAIFRVKMSCITSVDGITTLVIDLIGQLSCCYWSSAS